MKYLHYPLYCRGASGLSNLVMSCEVGVVASFLLDRVLVIEGNISPPANLVHYPALGVTNHPRAKITDLIELPVPWIDSERIDYDPDDAFVLGDDNLMHTVFVWPPELDDSSEDFRFFARGRTRFITETLECHSAQVVRLFPSSSNGHSMENLGFYSYFFYLDDPTRRAVHALMRAMQPKLPYAELARRVSASLGDFNAVHIRRGDFKKTFGTTTLDRTPGDVLRVLDQNFGRDETLMILTDEREDPFFDEITRSYPNSIFVDHHVLEHHRDEFFELPIHDSISLAYLSQLVAADSKDFVGSMTSTYTSMVQRYRGNRDKDECFKFLWNELPGPGSGATDRGSHPPSDCVPLHPDGSLVEEYEGPYSWNRVSSRLNPAWQREWPESFLLAANDADTVPRAWLAAIRSQRWAPADAGQADAKPQPTEPRGSEESVSESNAEATLVDVTVHLAGGPSFRTQLPSDSEILRKLFEALAAGTEGRSPSAPRLLQVPTEGGHTAYSFSSIRLIAVETSPPVLIEASALHSLEPQRQHADPPQARRAAGPHVPPKRVRRSPPVVHEVPSPKRAAYEPPRDFDPLPFVQVTDFLTPDEHRQLLESSLASESSFAPEPGRSTREVSSAFEPVLAECIANRLRLLLPQVLPALDLSRRVLPGDLRLVAHRDGDTLGGDSARASAASQDEITCCYFFHREPTPFSGGNIRLRKSENIHLVEPRNNAMMIYPTAALDEQMPLRCPSKAFGDSRFAVTARL